MARLRAAFLLCALAMACLPPLTQAAEVPGRDGGSPGPDHSPAPAKCDSDSGGCGDGRQPERPAADPSVAGALSHTVGFQYISLSWPPAAGARTYRLQVSYAGDQRWEPVPGAGSLEQTSFRAPFRYWDISWGRTSYRLLGCREAEDSCRTVGEAVLSQDDARAAVRAIELPLGALAAGSGAGSGARDGAALLRRAGTAAWTGFALDPPSSIASAGYSAMDTVAVGKGRETLVLLTGKPSLSNHRKLLFHSSAGGEWRAQSAAVLEPMPYDIDDLGGMRLLPLADRREGDLAREVSAVAISGSGDTVAVGLSSLRDSGRADRGAVMPAPPGAVAVFHRRGTDWRRQALLRTPGRKSHRRTRARDWPWPTLHESGAGFGAAIALSADGRSLFVGVPAETVEGAGADAEGDPVFEAGAVYHYRRRGGGWSGGERLVAAAPRPLERFGAALALSADGGTLAVGTDSEGAAEMRALAERHRRPDTEMPDEPVPSGAVHILRLIGGEWVHSAVVRPDSPGPDGAFGAAVALSADGNTLAVGAPSRQAGGAESARLSGAAYVFAYAQRRWRQRAFLAPPGPEARFFGLRVSVGDAGRTLLVQAVGPRKFETPAFDYPVKKLEDLLEHDVPGLLYYAY